MNKNTVEVRGLAQLDIVLLHPDSLSRYISYLRIIPKSPPRHHSKVPRFVCYHRSLDGIGEELHATSGVSNTGALLQNKTKSQVRGTGS